MSNINLLETALICGYFTILLRHINSPYPVPEGNHAFLIEKSFVIHEAAVLICIVCFVSRYAEHRQLRNMP